MGHWLLLLPRRRYAYMFIGLGCWLFAAVSMATGKTLQRFYGVVSRDEEPKRFRQNVVAYFIIGRVAGGKPLDAAPAFSPGTTEARGGAEPFEV
jgi:hypothetical protein